jgi:hypothetical protein
LRHHDIKGDDIRLDGPRERETSLSAATRHYPVAITAKRPLNEVEGFNIVIDGKNSPPMTMACCGLGDVNNVGSSRWT